MSATRCWHVAPSVMLDSTRQRRNRCPGSTRRAAAVTLHTWARALREAQHTEGNTRAFAKTLRPAFRPAAVSTYHFIVDGLLPAAATAAVAYFCPPSHNNWYRHHLSSAPPTRVHEAMAARQRPALCDHLTPYPQVGSAGCGVEAARQEGSKAAGQRVGLVCMVPVRKLQG